MPTIVEGISGGSSMGVGMLSSIPYAGAAIGMVLAGRHSDRTGERRLHLAIPAFTAGLCFLVCAVTHNDFLTFVAIVGALLSIWSMLGPFWGIATSYLGTGAAAAGIAMINSIGNLGGFAGPSVVGMAKELTGAYAAGFILIAAFLAAAGCLALTAGKPVPASERLAGCTDEP
jgi:ACS family tartrate transporter-like MFS transporter